MLRAEEIAAAHPRVGCLVMGTSDLAKDLHAAAHAGAPADDHRARPVPSGGARLWRRDPRRRASRPRGRRRVRGCLPAGGGARVRRQDPDPSQADRPGQPKPSRPTPTRSPGRAGSSRRTSRRRARARAWWWSTAGWSRTCTWSRPAVWSSSPRRSRAWRADPRCGQGARGRRAGLVIACAPGLAMRRARPSRARGWPAAARPDQRVSGRAAG